MRRLPVKRYDNGAMMFMCNVDFKSSAESKSNGKFEHIKNMHKIGVVTTEEAVNAVVNMCRAFNSEKPKMKKVRPMIDKDLRDEIVNYLGGDDSFNASLRQYVANHKGALLAIKHLKQEIAKLHNEKAGLNASIKEVEDNCAKLFNQTAPAMETIGKLMWGFAFGLFVGLFIL